LQVSGVGPRIADTHGASIIAICRSEAIVEIPSSASSGKSSPMQPSRTSPKSSFRPERSGVEKPPHLARIPATSGSAETFTRPRPSTLEPTDTLTSDQQALDQRLREWRKAESEKLNLPLFFVLASTTLRSIVLAHPKNLSQLKTIHGLGHEKIEKFGPGIIEVCTT
jgi:ATP-dependent DNA helicase RecQ